MSEQYDSLNEQTKLIEIALKYTDGNMDKAKAMASGQLLDNTVVKCKYYLQRSGHSGLFLAFFNVVDEYISYLAAALVANPSIYEKSRIFDDWKILFADMNAFKGGGDIVEMGDLDNKLIDGMVSKDVFPAVQSGDLDSLTKNIGEILNEVFPGEQVQHQLEIEPTSSLMMEVGGIELETPQQNEPEVKEKPKEQAPDETETERRMREVEEEANYIVEGASIVAPVKGKYINDISVGEKMMVLLPNKDPVSRKILSVLNAVDSEGRISPIKGRVKEIIPMEKGGSVIYALVAKGVLAKLVEEENVKIRMESADAEEVTEKSESKALVLMSVLLFLIIIGAVILFIYI